MTGTRSPGARRANEICRPTVPVTGETPEQTLARYQEAFEQLTECVNAELGVRPESSLFSFLFFKVIVPFAAISAAISTFYSRLVRAAKPHFVYTEHGLAALHLVIALAVFGLWLQYRKNGEITRFGRYQHRLRRMGAIAVPASKESISRNSMVNRWIFTCLTVGIVFIMPAIFFLFRANALEQMGGRFIIDTTGICRPTVGGYNPFEGSDTCTGGGIAYIQRPTDTGVIATLGGNASSAPIGMTTPNLDPNVIDMAEIRLDGTTALALFFIILIAGILVNMVRWWRADRKRARQLTQESEVHGAPS